MGPSRKGEKQGVDVIFQRGEKAVRKKKGNRGGGLSV